MYVMFGLLTVLFVSLGYLSMQGGREGLEGAAPPTTSATTITIGSSTPVVPPAGVKKLIVTPGSTQGFRGKK